MQREIMLLGMLEPDDGENTLLLNVSNSLSNYAL
jgi:hypothetical protein